MHRADQIDWFLVNSRDVEKIYERHLPTVNVFKNGHSHSIGISGYSVYAFCKIVESGDKHYFVLLPWQFYHDGAFIKV
jgi:hypothetical protein